MGGLATGSHFYFIDSTCTVSRILAVLHCEEFNKFVNDYQDLTASMVLD